eukprot:gnl/TRDRNA2_/TRDRNA2_177268_c4_seq4.p1 gnl/TRDRNA2_/TRDRNA2_177268_c4~~gnl/TRDRNA2_/TRDRNA2_177268_c4_seq4.p1  ORF type:complete len:731 (+),score=269.86 gnl/TRDRNA2_/TRDRNA2_177268_c4_seq4:96-2288(+)
MASMKNMTLLLLVLVASASASSKTLSGQQAKMELSVNPIRRVVTMLQMMQSKITAEGEKQQEAYDKFMCWCQNGEGQLEASIDAAKTKIPQVTSTIKEGEASLAQTKADVASAKQAREAAKAALAEASAIREKEAAAYAAAKTEADTNLAALKKALSAIEKGSGAAFLQTHLGQVLQNLIVNDESLSDIDREVVTSFLSTDQSYGDGKSGQIVGILKTMQETMEKDLKEAEETEAAAITSYDELMAAKKKEIEVATVSIEKKTKRTGELAVEIVQMKGDLEDTQEQLVEDEKFLAELDKTCAAKQAEWAERVKMRQEELLALADTIKILNDDDALELFKKTLPASGSSFVQVAVSAKEMRERALEIIRKAKSGKHNPRLDLVALALSGKKNGLDGVIKMIDEMAATLKKEQEDDDHKKEYCLHTFDVTDDKKKALEKKISDLETSVEEDKDAISTLVSEIDALGDGIRELDKSVAEATEVRKEENEDYTAFMASNAAAKELIGFAKNRMQKFYNPKAYKAPPKRELTEDEQATLAAGGTLAPTVAPAGIAGTGVTVFAQVSMHTQSTDVLPPPPETFGAYAKKSDESGGVMAMMDMITKDIDVEMSDAEHAEKTAQADYEEMMTDSKEKRALDTKALTDKESTKASMEAELQADTDAKAGAGKELMATSLYLSQLHGECDFLLEYFDARKEAREAEHDELLKGKAALSGADFALLQTKTTERSRNLRKSA